VITRKEIYALVLLLVAAIALPSYLGYVKDTAKAETTEQVIERVLNQKLADIQKDREQVKTPSDVARVVPKYTPDVKPLLIVAAGPQTHDQTVSDTIPSVTLPDAPSAIVGGLVIPKEQVPAYWKSVTECAEDKVKLEACEPEKEAWKKAARMGFWTRAWNCGVSVVTNTGSGGAFGGTKGAAVGAGFGALGCVLQKH
jgi:hypothetical protein